MKANKIYTITGTFRDFERIGMALKDRDNWKTRALAYKDIIKRARKSNDYFVFKILAEADKLEGK